jgi:hypothetical protein
MSPDDERTPILGQATWRDVLIALIAAAALVAMSFAPPASCKVRIGDSDTTTTTESVR